MFYFKVLAHPRERERVMSDFNQLVLIGTGSSFAFCALFYSLYKEKQEQLRKLRVSTVSV